ncbi:MAG TPA: rod shape-determining protein RodA [Patescibacteria group bacterium]|nr:rod shape-determining protein RodA [Patescibacteria group bacterium]
MNKRFFEFDWALLFIILILLTIGLVTISSLDRNLFFQQFFHFLIGLLFFILFSKIDYHLYQRYKWWLFIGALVFLSSTFVFGAVTRGSIRWIRIFGLTLQPSELIKPLLVVFFASLFFELKKLSLTNLLKAGGLIMIPVLLIFLQPDLSSSLVVLTAWLGIVLATGISWKIVVSSFVFFLAGLPISWRLLKPYQQQRIFSFLNPLADPLGAGYNLIQSVVAVGSGQLLGRGLGKGTQAQLMFLPERHSDFIFATIAEEFGFLGSFFLIVLIGFLFWRLLEIARSTRDGLGFLISLGIFTLLVSQTLINIGMNLGLLPITGVTLPLVSYGGSSLVASLISLGIINNIAIQKKRNQALEIK